MAIFHSFLYVHQRVCLLKPRQKNVLLLEPGDRSGNQTASLPFESSAPVTEDATFQVELEWLGASENGGLMGFNGIYPLVMSK